MSLYDTSGTADLRPNTALEGLDGDYLELDDVLSRSGNDLVLEADGEGFLRLSEGADFE